MKTRYRCTNCRRYLEKERVPKDLENLWNEECTCCGYNHWDAVEMPDTLAVQPNIPMFQATIEQLREEMAYWQSRPDGKGPRAYIRECKEWIERKETKRG